MKIQSKFRVSANTACTLCLNCEITGGLAFVTIAVALVKQCKTLVTKQNKNARLAFAMGSFG